MRIFRAFFGFVILCFAQNCYAQATAIEVLSDRDFSVSALKIEILSGISAIRAKEKWEIVGTCKTFLTQKVQFVSGISAISADLSVEIVEGLAAIRADRKICISNFKELSSEAKELLGLSD